MNIRRIITHPGVAHADEVLACACIVAAHATDEDKSLPPICRRTPTDKELNDPSIWVVDCGEQYTPELHNFDHHQFPKSHAPICSLSLVMKHLFDDSSDDFYMRAKQAHPWLEALEVRDSKGPRSLAVYLRRDWDTELVPMISPFELHMLEQFRRSAAIERSTDLWENLYDLGTFVIHHTVDFTERLHLLRDKGQLVTCKGLKVLVCPDCMFNTINEAGIREYHDPALAVDQWRKEIEPHAAISLFPDERGSGYSLYRYEDNSRIDFRKVRDNPEVIFVHASGFLAKTKTQDLKIALALVEEATK
jgi:hypothetical protein